MPWWWTELLHDFQTHCNRFQDNSRFRRRQLKRIFELLKLLEFKKQVFVGAKLSRVYIRNVFACVLAEYTHKLFYS